MWCHVENAMSRPRQPLWVKRLTNAVEANEVVVQAIANGDVVEVPPNDTQEQVSQTMRENEYEVDYNAETEVVWRKSLRGLEVGDLLNPEDGREDWQPMKAIFPDGHIVEVPTLPVIRWTSIVANEKSDGRDTWSSKGWCGVGSTARRATL